MNLDNVIRELNRRRFLITATTILGVLIAVAYWVWIPPEYESFARVLVMAKDPAMASATQAEEEAASNEVSDDVLATHLEIMRSNSIVDRALKRSELADLSSITPHLKEDQAVTDYIVERLWATQGTDDAKGSRVINIGFRHYDAEDSRRVVEAIVKEYQAFLAEQFQDVSTQATTLIAQAEGELEKEIEALEAEHLELRKQAPLRMTRGDRVTNVHEDAFAEIEHKASELKLRLAEANGRLNSIREKKSSRPNDPAAIGHLSFIGEEDIPRLSIFTELLRSSAAQPAFLAQQPIRSESVRAEMERMSELRAKEKSLLDEYGAKHPDVVQAQNEISSLESAIKKKQGQLTNYEATKDINASDILDAYSTALANDIEVMNQRLQTLQGMASQEEKKSKELVNFELTDKIMTSRVERKQALYDAVVSRLHDLNLRSGYGSYVNALLVTPTTGGRVWPRLSICGAAGAAGGFLLGCMIAVLGYLTNGRFRTMGELRQSLSIPVLASLPRIRTAFYGYSLSPEEKAAGRANWDPHLAVQFSPRSPAANAIRGLRNSLLVTRSNPSGNLLFLTSPRNGSGASTTAANLALSIAQAGRSVLLVDANSGKPRLHTMFGYQRVPGLAEVLEGTADLPDTTVPLDTHLRLLTAGEPMRTPADVFQSTRFIEFCEMVRSRYEWIIFDGPPVLDSSEAQVLASIISDTLLVVRVGKDKREQVLKAGSEIVRHGGHFVGTVANAWDAQSGFFADDWIRTEEVARQVPTYEVVHSGNGNGYARPEVNPVAKS